MAQYRLYTGGPYKQNNGSAITSSSTDVTTGAAKNVRDGDILSRSDWRSGTARFPSMTAGVNNVGVVEWTALEGDGDCANSSEGLVQLTSTGHGLAVGDVIRVTSADEITVGVYRVVRVVDGDNFVINHAGVGSQSGGIAFEVGQGDFANFDPDVYAVRKTSDINGLASGGSDNGRRRKVAKHSDTIRTRKTGTAIRTGKYNTVDGTFDEGYPESSSDSMNSDDETVDATTELGVKGELSFKHSGAAAQSKDYESKTG